MFQKKYTWIILALFLITVFFLTSQTTENVDVWFHIKSGEIISQQGLLSHDVFSQHAAERPWYMYEWLFQLSIYWFTHFFGIDSVKYFVGLLVTIQVALIYGITRYIFKSNLLISFFSATLYLLLTYIFLSSRPQIMGYMLLITNIALIFMYLFRHKNFLWITVVISYLWSMTHGSLLISNMLFTQYAIIAFIAARKTANQDLFKKAKILGFITAANWIVSILPPTGLMQYETLSLLTNHKEILYQFDEWKPLFLFVSECGLYLGMMLVSAIPISWYAWRKRDKTFLWMIPLWSLILFGFTAVRQTYFGYLAMTLMTAWFLSQVTTVKITTHKKYLLIAACSLALLILPFLLFIRSTTANYYVPSQEAAFIKAHKLQGNMYNDLDYGPYLLYKLYPEKKVFIDGRMDVYLCCEAPDYFAFQNSSLASQEIFNNTLNSLLHKYDISIVIANLFTKPGVRMLDKLRQDPNWVIVFWNDNTVILLKDNGSNQHVIDTYKLKAATPYSAQVYKEGMIDQALIEYLRMDKIASSSHTKNSIGYIYMQKGKTQEAKKYFKEAISINLHNSASYANLAELITIQGKTQEAIDLYKQAIESSPDKPAYYLRLAHLYLSIGKTEYAKATLKDGLKNVPYPNAQKVLKANLQKLQ